jgi:hypothetical protein
LITPISANEIRLEAYRQASAILARLGKNWSLPTHISKHLRADCWCLQAAHNFAVLE